MAKIKTLATIQIVEIEENGKSQKCIDILKDGYNIVDKSIYDDEKVNKILEILQDEN